MKKLLLIILVSSAFTSHAQTPDSASLKAAAYFKEAQKAAKNQKIWSKALYGPMFFVDPQSRAMWANTPDSAGTLKPDGEVYKGTLPKDIIIANTSVHWQGKNWSMILWPLPEDHDERLNLMMHESFHRIQESLGLPANSPTIKHLNTMQGRIYFLLELQALKAALNKPVNQRKADLENALLFREKRHLLFPETFENERVLEMNEGLAEYTGVILGRGKDSIEVHLNEVINGAVAFKSLIRSMAYITGPVYGYLLYQAAPNWTSKVTKDSSFPELVETWYHIKPPSGDINTQVEKIMDQYNGKSIIASETIKEEEHKKKLNNYVDIFTKKPILTITAVKMNVGFNPSNLFDLGDYGTVYPTAEVRDSWGEMEVTADSGGMLMKDWKVITLPITDEPALDSTSISGKGWKLTLNPGWKVIKSDASHYTLIKGN